MSDGIRSIVKFSEPEGCPIATLSNEVGSTIHSVSTSVPSDGRSASVSEFIIPGHDGIPDGEVSQVFSIGSTSICRLSHTSEQDCPCKCLGEFETPIAQYRAREGALTLQFHAPDFDRLQTILSELDDRYRSLDIRRLTREPGGHQSDEAVLVNRGALTPRQLHVLKTAYGGGYFDRPRGANATEIAEVLDIAPSTFSEHVSVALSKLLGDVLDDHD